MLAAGTQERWGTNSFKQLLEFADETLLGRMQRQAAARDLEPVIVTHHSPLARVAVRHFVPAIHRWTAETLLATRELWTSRTIVLLGDVIYSAACMDAIASSRRPASYFFVRKDTGRHVVTEIVAMSFEDHQAVVDACRIAINRAESGTREARLAHVIPKLRGAVGTRISDWTTDFDRLEDVERFNPRLIDELSHDAGQ